MNQAGAAVLCQTLLTEQAEACIVFFHWEFKPAVMPLFLTMFVFHCFHRPDMDINEKLATSGKLIENVRVM